MAAFPEASEAQADFLKPRSHGFLPRKGTMKSTGYLQEAEERAAVAHRYSTSSRRCFELMPEIVVLALPETLIPNRLDLISSSCELGLWRRTTSQGCHFVWRVAV